MKYIYAKDMTPLLVDNSVIHLMSEMVEGPTTFDFSGVNVMDRALESLATISINRGVGVVGLSDESRQLFESFVVKINEPTYDSIDSFEKMFFSKFPVGTLCIWDKSLTKKLDVSENVFSLVYVEGLSRNHVVFRVYYSHLVEPKYFHEYGGIHAKELYKIEKIHISDFATKDVLFRYPNSPAEELILEILKKAGDINPY